MPGLMAVAAPPPLAGLTGDAFNDPVAYDDGFGAAMLITAALALAGSVLAGSVLAWLTISDDVLVDDAEGLEALTEEPCWTCPTDGSPLRPSTTAVGRD